MYHNQREIKRTFSPPSDLIKYRNYLYFEYVMYLSVIEHFADFVIELGIVLHIFRVSNFSRKAKKIIPFFAKNAKNCEKYKYHQFVGTQNKLHLLKRWEWQCNQYHLFWYQIPNWKSNYLIRKCGKIKISSWNQMVVSTCCWRSWFHGFILLSE